MRTGWLAVALAFLVAAAAAGAAGSLVPLQHGASQGARVDVYSSGTAIFDLRRIAPTARHLLNGPHGLNYGCIKARLNRGLWHAGEYMLASPFKTRLRFSWTASLSVPQPVPPYDGCELGGAYGHRWDDAFGTRDAVEIWLTVRGRHFFNDRAAARDLAYFVRSRRVQQIRLSAAPRAGLQWFVRRYPRRVVELTAPGGRVPRNVIGFWIGPRTIAFTATSSTHRRFFVVARRGTLKLPSNNLGDLAFVF
jgi:hypothetical protein